MSQTVFRKACGCRSSASGPRVMQTRATDLGSRGTVFAFALVRMACDNCDVPWIREAP